MAMSVDWPNKLITVNQSDLTFVGGTLYEMNTETQFRQPLMALADDAQGMAWLYPLRHNTEVTVAGTTFARTIELINGYSWQLLPDTAWSCRLSGSNNNLFDVENGILTQNSVQVIAQNSAGLQTVTSGSGVLPQDVTDIKNAIYDEAMENGMDFRDFMMVIAAAMAGKTSGMDTANGIFRNMADDKNRISVTMDGNGNRTSITFDLT